MNKLFGVFLFCLASLAEAQLALDVEKSSLHFVSVKNNSVAEVLTFDRLKGSVSDEGVAVLEIDLVSVNTQIETRDQRMRDSLFQVDQFPVATITTTVDMKQIKDLDVGEEVKMELKGQLDLHGEKANVFASVIVSKNENKAIRVTTIYPVMVHARHFQLVKGIGILRKQAGLTVISSVVPVSFSLVFDKP